MLHVAQIGFFNDPQGRRGSELLQQWHSLADVAEAACSAGVRVSVIQSCAADEVLIRNGVQYHFLSFGHRGSTPQGRAAFRQLLAGLAPDVIHVHGLEFPRQVFALAGAFPRIPILIQDHASRPPRFWRRAVWRRGLSVAAGLAFCASAQADAFLRQGLVHSGTAIFAIPESTSRFSVGDRAQARAATGLAGEPCLLWVGHLNDNKDPLTVLDGVAVAARSLPGLQLWCCFGSAPLLSEVERRVESDRQLAGRVHLLGQLPHDRIEILMRAADFFILGSHREGSGYALIEAMACGLFPVVTDIPSFRSLIGEGQAGRLWRRGDAQGLARALVEVAQQPREGLRLAARAHFDAELSAAAVGRKLRAAYEKLAGQPRILAVQ